jgi:hypothetical protein
MAITTIGMNNAKLWVWGAVTVSGSIITPDMSGPQITGTAGAYTVAYDTTETLKYPDGSTAMSGADAKTGWLPVFFKTLNYTSNSVEQDDTTSVDFDTLGTLWQSKIKTALGGSFSFESVRRSDPTTGVNLRDPAQTVIELMDRQMGGTSKGWFALGLTDANYCWVFKATVKATPFGGGLTDIMTFKADITIAGKPSIYKNVGWYTQATALVTGYPMGYITPDLTAATLTN